MYVWSIYFLRFCDLNGDNISDLFLSPPMEYYRPVLAYNQSKLCGVLFAMELNRRYSRRGVFCNALHPGNIISTGLPRNWWIWRVIFTLVRPFAKSKVRGCRCVVYMPRPTHSHRSNITSMKYLVYSGPSC